VDWSGEIATEFPAPGGKTGGPLLIISILEQMVFPHELVPPSIKMVFGRSFVRLKHEIVVVVRLS
jgi:hypothetical protein